VLVRTENEIETARSRFVVVGDKLAPPTPASINGGTAAASYAYFDFSYKLWGILFLYKPALAFVDWHMQH
jgi:hypothetical protein